MNVAEIIIENERRKARNLAPFNPISGQGSVGERFEYKERGATIFLPLSMKSIPGLARLSDEMFERLRIEHDFPYWAARYAFIKAKGGGEDILFHLNRPQRRLVEMLEKQRVAGRPIRLILLKARQWGGSTCAQIYMSWLQLVHQKGLNSLIIAQQKTATDEIKDMFDRLISSYPVGLMYEPGEECNKDEKKTEGVGQSRAITRIPQRKCKIKVATAERPDASRGGDYNLIHCSEVGLWKTTAGKSPEMIVRAATSGVLFEPLTMIIYESTANGSENFFHNEYQAAKQGTSQFSPLFISWFDIDRYSLPLDDPETFAARLLERRRSEGALSDREEPGAYLWWLWEKGATLEAINWYIAERAKFSDHAMMAAEYPSDDVEAFVHSGSNVFDLYQVEKLKSDCHAPLFTGEIDSPLIPRRGLPEDDAFRRRQLEEVQFTAGNGAWQIWEQPVYDPSPQRLESRYVAVVDVGGRGPKSDWSVIVIFDREPLIRGDRPRVVAQWRGHIDFDLLAWKAALGASLYDDAILVIESNTMETRDPARQTDGDQSEFILNRLRNIYPNLYARRRSEQAVRQGSPVKYGFHTNAATKPLIIATLVKVIRDNLYVERDIKCLGEYLSYERSPEGRFGASSGCHDDLLMTRAIGLHIIFHELPLPAPKAEQSPPRSHSIGSHAVW